LFGMPELKHRSRFCARYASYALYVHNFLISCPFERTVNAVALW
jgi:hypothetical protein